MGMNPCCHALAKQNAALRSQVERAGAIIDEQAEVIQRLRPKDPDQLELCFEVIETTTVQLNCFARIS